MMKKITGMVLCLALLLSMGCAYATPDAEKVNTYAVESCDVQLAFHLYETFTWYIPDDTPNMLQYGRARFASTQDCGYGETDTDTDAVAQVGVKNVSVGTGVLNMYVSSDNEFELKCTSDADQYKNLNLALDYNIYKSPSETAEAINKGTAKTYQSKNLYKVFSVKTTDEEHEETLYYEIQEISQFAGLTYQDHLTFYALVETNN